MPGMEGAMNLVRTTLTREGFFVPNESDLGVKPSEFNKIAEDDYRPDAFSKLSKRVIYGGGLLFFGLLLAGCAPKPPGPDGGGGGDGNNNSNTDSLCPNLLRIAAANSVDVASRLPAWQAADQAQLQQDLACFAPEASSLTIAEILTVGQNAGEEVVQVAWARGGEVTPLLAVPGETVDVNNDGTPDLQLVNFFDPHTSQWEALTPDQAQAQLTSVKINSATGDIEAEESGVMITATRDFNKNITFQIVNPDGTQVTLSQDQVKNNLALGPWLNQVENLFSGQEMLSFDVVTGVDLSTSGEKYTLPQEVFAAGREKQLAPIETEGSKFAASCTNNDCTVMLTDVLVSGAKLRPASDGKVSYGFDGEAGSEALFRFNGLPEGVRSTSFVAQEGNPWGFKAGTVVVWFWQGGDKGPARILNLDNPLQIMADKPNSISLTVIDNGLLITRTGPDGTVIDEQTVAFLPPLPSEFLSQFDGTEFSVEGVGMVYNTPGGEKITVPGHFNASGGYEFNLNGSIVKAPRDQLNVWNVVEENHLLIKGENAIPQYQFNLESKAWEAVEQVSMVDAFGNTVLGWVVEKSDVWEGEISQTPSLLITGKYNSDSGTSFVFVSNVTLKQWELMEFINSDGVKMQRLNFTWIFKNDEDKVITVKVGMPELNYGARIEQLTPRQFVDSLVVGGQTGILSFAWIDTLSAMTPEKRAEFLSQYTRDGELCEQSVQACGLSVGRMGEVKHPTSWFDDIYNGLLGDNLDIADEVWCQRPVK